MVKTHSIPRYFLKIILLAWFFVSGTNGFSGSRPESKTQITVQANRVKAIHFHNLQNSNYDSFRNIVVQESPFSPRNTYSRLVLVNLRSKDTIFNGPTIPMDKMYITKNGFIIGITNLKFINSYEMVVYNLKGELVFFKAIVSNAIRCSKTIFEELRQSFSKEIGILDSLGLVMIKDDFVYLDVFQNSFVRELNYEFGPFGDTIASRCESVGNLDGLCASTSSGFRIYWYDKDHPKPKVKSNKKVFYAITITDICGHRFTFYRTKTP